MSYIMHHKPTALLNEVNKIIEYAFKQHSSDIKTNQWIPAADMKEEKNQFIVLLDLPGIDKNNINISTENNVLIIKGSRIENANTDENNYFRIERVKGNFHRRFTLPEAADVTKIEAKMQKGVLEIFIPKKETEKERSIDIQCCE